MSQIFLRGDLAPKGDKLHLENSYFIYCMFFQLMLLGFVVILRSAISAADAEM